MQKAVFVFQSKLPLKTTRHHILADRTKRRQIVSIGLTIIRNSRNTDCFHRNQYVTPKMQCCYDWSDLAPSTLADNVLWAVSHFQRPFGKASLFFSLASERIIVNVTKARRWKGIREHFRITLVVQESFAVPFWRSEVIFWGIKLISSESIILSWNIIGV